MEGPHEFHVSVISGIRISSKDLMPFAQKLGAINTSSNVSKMMFTRKLERHNSVDIPGTKYKIGRTVFVGSEESKTSYYIMIDSRGEYISEGYPTSFKLKYISDEDIKDFEDWLEDNDIEGEYNQYVVIETN